MNAPGLVSLLLGAVLLSCACESSQRTTETQIRTPAPQVTARSQKAAAQAPIQLAPPAQSGRVEPDKKRPPVVASTYRAGPRVVAVGDLHGDYAATLEVLQLVGATNDQNAWVGGALTLVQTGDQLDRGDGERAILDLLIRLKDQAEAAGGNVVILNGNHETMNVTGDFRYVTERGFAEFEGADPRPLPETLLRQLPPSSRSRAAAFFPGGTYARRLAAHPVIAVVGDSVFAHGGVLMSQVEYGIDKLNAEVKQWLLGDGPAPQEVLSPDAPVWTRLYSEGEPSQAACRQLSQVLESLGVRRMVVGHTVQKMGITSGCEQKIWRIDVGMSSYYAGSSVSALEITGGQVRVLQRQKRAQK